MYGTWERQLLSYTDNVTSEHAIAQAITRGSTIRISYHGAHIDVKSIFLWTIHASSLLNWTGKGDALGQPTTKLRVLDNQLSSSSACTFALTTSRRSFSDRPPYRLSPLHLPHTPVPAALDRHIPASFL
jgi:hypothetical protein